jgi:hypothetical protein
VGVAAAAVASGAVVLSGCEPSKEEQFEQLVTQGVQDKDIETLNVETEQVLEASNFDEVAFDKYLKLEATWELPFGSLLYQVDTTYALVMLPGGVGESLRKLALLDLGTGTLTTLREASVGTGKNVVIYDARASRTRLIWVEVDLGSRSWRTYVAPLVGAMAGEARMVEEGDSDYDPPLLAVAGDKAYWTVMPNATGPANLEDSLLMALGSFQETGGGEGAGLGAVTGTPYTVLASHGRMITNPLVTNGIVTFVPRVDTSNVYYQLTALNCSNDKAVDFQILPRPLRVTDALYLGSGFLFCIEDTYEYEDVKGIFQFGTYLQLDQETFLHVNRPPTCAAVRLGDCLIVKSTASIVGIDLVKRATFVVDLPPLCSAFGEALAGWGNQEKVVTYSVRMGEGEERDEGDEGAQGAGATLVRIFGPAEAVGSAGAVER